MPSKTRSRAQAPAQTGKGREIAGICLLGLGVFCGLSLISSHAGSGTMMGPGGRATASGLYTLAGVGAYLLVGVLLIVAVRVFRGLAWHRSFNELSGIVGFLAGSTVLLHLAFAGLPQLPGPGGVMGRWLSDLGVSFIGTVGAALVASVLLVVSSMVLTSLSVGEVSAVGVWIAHQSVRALVTTARGVGRLVAAMFPRKNDQEIDRELLAAAENPFDSSGSFDPDLFEPSELDDTLPGEPPGVRHEPILWPAPRRVSPPVSTPAHQNGRGPRCPPQTGGPVRGPRCCMPCRRWRATPSWSGSPANPPSSSITTISASSFPTTTRSATTSRRSSGMPTCAPGAALRGRSVAVPPPP
jgi:hypothetical protein